MAKRTADTVYDKLNPLAVQRDYEKIAAKDPWFALGMSIGDGYWNNYNSRGLRKSEATADDIIKQTLGGGQQPAEQTQEAGQVQGITNWENWKPSGGVEIPKMGEKVSGVFNGAANPAQTQLDGTQWTPNGTMQEPSIKEKIALENRNYLVNKYADDDNPGRTRMDAEGLTKTINANIDQVGNMEGYRKQEVLDQIKAKLRSDGRTDAQIQVALDRASANIDARLDGYNKDQGKIHAGEAMKLLKDGKIDEAFFHITQAARYGDPTANAILGQHNFQQHQQAAMDKEKRDEERQIRAEDRQFAKQARIISMRGASGGGGGGGGKPFDPFTNPRFKFHWERYQLLAKKDPEELTPQEKQWLTDDYAVISATTNYAPERPDGYVDGNGSAQTKVNGAEKAKKVKKPYVPTIVDEHRAENLNDIEAVQGGLGSNAATKKLMEKWDEISPLWFGSRK